LKRLAEDRRYKYNTRQITVLWQKVLPMPIPILLLKSNANTNTFVTILFIVYYIQQHSFFDGHPLIKFNSMIVIEKWQNHYSLQ